MFHQILNILKKLLQKNRRKIAKCETLFFFELKNNQKSKDELFHVYVYNWLFRSDLVNCLFMIQSPLSESYLKRIIQNDSISIAAHDLLWRYYNTVS